MVPGSKHGEGDHNGDDGGGHDDKKAPAAGRCHDDVMKLILMLINHVKPVMKTFGHILPMTPRSLAYLTS